jgi:hypothetical protein
MSGSDPEDRPKREGRPWSLILGAAVANLNLSVANVALSIGKRSTRPRRCWT